MNCHLTVLTATFCQKLLDLSCEDTCELYWEGSLSLHYMFAWTVSDP